MIGELSCYVKRDRSNPNFTADVRMTMTFSTAKPGDARGEAIILVNEIAIVEVASVY